MTPRVYLMADLSNFGNGGGPGVLARTPAHYSTREMADWAQVNEARIRVSGTAARAGYVRSAAIARAWWLVEAESADAARATIRAAQAERAAEGVRSPIFGGRAEGIGLFVNQPGRILASGGAK